MIAFDCRVRGRKHYLPGMPHHDAAKMLRLILLRRWQHYRFLI